MKKGIYLVANLKSQDLCSNLIYSIRSSGCTLPIRVIHFGGEKIKSTYILKEVEFLTVEDFSEEAQTFIKSIRSVLLDCPMGYLYRFLPFFGDWDEFIYSDNDIVALMDWQKLFDYLSMHDIVHADEEYTTEGRFNHDQPLLVKQLFGENALEAAITAGHFAAKASPKLVADMEKAIEWFKENPNIPKKHDQALMHIASLLGKWNALNLCKQPHNWLSSWSGDYKTPLVLIQSIQQNPTRYISHLHYSGSTPHGDKPIEEFLFSNVKKKNRIITQASAGFKEMLGVYDFIFFKNKVKRRLKSMMASKK